MPVRPSENDMNAPSARDWKRFDSIRSDLAAERIAGVVRRTPLVRWPCEDERVELRAKLENRQEIGAFKARGAWNHLVQLDARARSRGVVATSSGNHGKALAWAAARAGVPATIVMPSNAYPNKIAACREYGANVVLEETRERAEARCKGFVEEGLTLVHPYDSERTIEGAGTVGLEIAEEWPEVDVLIVPVGGGGLIAGCALAVRRALGERVRILGAEPSGAPTLTRGLAAGRPVVLEQITTSVQGLCPLNAGVHNVAIAAETVDGVVLLEDAEILAAQRVLVHGGEVVEPAGAAAAAVVFAAKLPPALLEGKSARAPLRVAVVVSGGNPDPEQLARVRGERA
jgi:threonine dehydratase